jgi:hypothetical protein
VTLSRSSWTPGTEGKRWTTQGKQDAVGLEPKGIQGPVEVRDPEGKNVRYVKGQITISQIVSIIKSWLRSLLNFKALLGTAGSVESVDTQATTRQHVPACALQNSTFVNSLKQALKCTDAIE